MCKVDHECSFTMRFIYYVIGCCMISGVQSLLNITLSAKLNGITTLPCRIPMPVNSGVIVRWYSGKDKWLTSGRSVYQHRDRMTIEKPAPNEWNLRIKKLDISFADVYTCHADNNVTLSIIDLVIESAPQIDDALSTQKDYRVKENDVAILRCIASGTPPPTIEWYRGNEEKAIRVYGTQLKIRKVSRYASDVYTCRATNKIGATRKQIKLDVTFEPEVSVMSQEVYASGGEAVVMSCVVQGSPLNGVFWTDKQNKQISTNWKYLVMEEDAGDGTPVKFINLIFRPAIISTHDYGSYTCNAKGDHTTVTKVVQLKKRVVTTRDGEKIINYD